MLRTLLAALTAAALLPATAQAGFPGANGRIAFNWTFGCDGSVIATIKPGGTGLKRLTADPCKIDGAPRAVYPDFSADGARIAFAEAMIGNFDWCLKFSPDDIYRCNEPKPLWNVLAFDIGGGKTSLLMKDFDLAGVVVGRHGWFDKVWNRGFVASKSETEIEVLSQVQRTRSLFPRAVLDAERRHFLERKSAALDAATVDDSGRAIARAYLDAFFGAIATDELYYRPIVARSDVRVFLDAEGTREACGPKDVMRSGTPVNEIQRSGSMSQVVILDAMWRWASRNECNAVQDGPVWIPSDAITRNFPAR
jgi:hypothetical protein